MFGLVEEILHPAQHNIMAIRIWCVCGLLEFSRGDNRAYAASHPPTQDVWLLTHPIALFIEYSRSA